MPHDGTRPGISPACRLPPGCMPTHAYKGCDRRCSYRCRLLLLWLLVLLLLLLLPLRLPLKAFGLS